jgi:flagellar basal body P-ring protein FlgI
LWAAGAAVLGLLGCTLPQTRLQSADDDADRYGLKTVGDVTEVGNADPVPLGCVGLVEGLDGTGAPPTPDNYRTMLENDLRKALKEDDLHKAGVKSVREYLESNDRALVVVTASIPPGANAGDPIDVEVTLPPRSRAKSLRGGYLRFCRLFEYEYTKNLSPDYPGSNVALPGHCRAVAEGSVLVGMGEGDESAKVRHGRVWAGGRVKAPNPLLLLLKAGMQQARLAAVVADRVNEAFRGAPGAGTGPGLAEAHNKEGVQLRVPAAYHLNLPRYLRVVRMIPLQDGSAAEHATADPRPYRRRLAEDLRNPARTVETALRMEALGPETAPTLKAALTDEDPLVRFCAAEALAYLGSSAASDELVAAVVKQPMLRAFALTALASLDDAASRLKLRELLTTSTDDETRYGAFRALRALDEHDLMVRGELLNDSFWLHRVASDAQPLVHISSTKRAEIVLFGETPTFKPPLAFLAGEFAVTATENDDHCIVTRFPLNGEAVRRQCSLKLEQVLRTMADLGGTYPEAIMLLQQAHDGGCLSCRVVCDALPQAVTVQELDAAGKSGDLRLLNSPRDLGATPTLFERP